MSRRSHKNGFLITLSESVVADEEALKKVLKEVEEVLGDLPPDAFKLVQYGILKATIRPALLKKLKLLKGVEGIERDGEKGV